MLYSVLRSASRCIKRTTGFPSNDFPSLTWAAAQAPVRFYSICNDPEHLQWNCSLIDADILQNDFGTKSTLFGSSSNLVIKAYITDVLDISYGERTGQIMLNIYLTDAVDVINPLEIHPDRPIVVVDHKLFQSYDNGSYRLIIPAKIKCAIISHQCDKPYFIGFVLLLYHVADDPATGNKYRRLGLGRFSQYNVNRFWLEVFLSKFRLEEIVLC